MAGLTIRLETKTNFDRFKELKGCSSSTAIEVLLLQYEYFDSLNRENKLLRAENERLKAKQGD